MKHLLVILILLSSRAVFGQGNIEWSPEYKIEAADFKSPATQIGGNLVAMSLACRMEFSYQMSNYEFLFTKNFNSKVSTLLTPSASYYTPRIKKR